MRYAGLCSVLLLIPAACDDAVGAGYPDDTSSAVIEATRAERAPAEEPVSGSEANVADTDDRSSSRSVSDPEERAASLGLTQEADYTCNQESVSAHVVFYGDEDLTAVLIPGKVNVPLYLDCSPTRIGPECSDGQFTAQFNVLDDTALFYALEDGAPLTCSMAQPDLPPDLE
jgi:hypothetical protein